ncbi:MAG: hypothetical protein JO016_19720 [Actinobacteria bacterium]|nr:hypothetical protein [Actinomycetota bacterium]
MFDPVDAMLIDLYNRNRQGHAHSEAAWAEAGVPQSFAVANRAAQASEREAHVREVERCGRTLPEGSYGRQNRDAIADRETRIAARLRVVEHAYRAALERDAMFSSPEDIRPSRTAQPVADREIEPE